MADTTVLGLFDDVTPAADALSRLKSETRSDWRDVMALSSIPFPEGVLDADRSPTLLPIITVVAAIAGIAIGIALAGGTALLYVIPQGGKPILSGPPTAIISYEVMMLVALTSVFFRALFEMHLPGWQAKVYDPRIAEGMIGIAAHCATESQAVEAERVLRESGAADILRDPRRFE